MTEVNRYHGSAGRRELHSLLQQCSFYNNVVSNRGRAGKKNKPLHSLEDTTKNIETQKAEGNNTHAEQGTHEEDRQEEKAEDRGQGTENRTKMGLCKPKTNTKPRVILNDPALQEHRDHMANYAIMCKFMGIWPIEKALYTWIKYNWKPKGELNIHLGSKGFFTVVFTNMEDRDRIFEGGPYFYASAALYMRPWTMNFVSE